MLFAAPYWGSIKESYFNYVFEQCNGRYASKAVAWHRVDMFDATQREFIGFNDTTSDTIGCTNRWAGIIISDAVEPANLQMWEGQSKLRVTISGSNFAPPEKNVRIEYIEYVNSTNGI